MPLLMSLVNRENLSAKKIDKESPIIGHMKAGVPLEESLNI